MEALAGRGLTIEDDPKAADRPDPRPSGPWAPLDRALAAYHAGGTDAAVVMTTDVGGREDVPVALFFRDPSGMSGLERAALADTTGRTLDLGACAGAFSVSLLELGVRVTAAEVLPTARRILVERGVADVRAGGLEALGPDERFETVLILMNGLGLAGSLAGLTPFLATVAARLAPGGRILADSTDPTDWEDPGDGRAPGEVHMQLAFEGRPAEPFPFLFVSPTDLRAHADAAGLRTEILVREEDGRYLARLTPLPP